MCGIAGISAAAGVDPETLLPALRAMLEAEAHRGPDDHGAWSCADVRGTALLGHRRLAILDPSPSGHQPMHDPSTGNWIAFNGEIYNHLELRRELERPGEPWRSRSDTETLLRGYAVWGVGLLPRLRGMFAFAVWDAQDGSLLCARDRLGIKPLYLHRDAERVTFASEVRALLRSGLVPRSVSRSGLAGYVRFGAVPEPWTIVEGVRSLEPGTWMRLKGGREVASGRYWDLAEIAAAPGPRLEAAELARELRRAVQEHLLSDVPVGVFLSGGLDSTVIASLAAEAGGSLASFTLGFSDARFDESELAESVARRANLRHTTVRLAPSQVAALVPRAVADMDLPTQDGVNTWLIARIVREAGLKVVLSGLGGDELFGGYPAFRMVSRAERWSRLVGALPAPLRARLGGGAGRGERFAALTQRGASRAERYEATRALWSGAELCALGIEHAAPLTAVLVDPPLPCHTAVSLLELSGYMRATLLRDSDALSMCHSLELRVPLLDHQLVERCLRGGAANGAEPKALLRRVARDLVPRELLDRPKRGFTLPMDEWLRGPLSTHLNEGLERLETQSFLAPGATGLVRERFLRGELGWARPWSLAVLGHWLAATEVGYTP